MEKKQVRKAVERKRAFGISSAIKSLSSTNVKRKHEEITAEPTVTWSKSKKKRLRQLLGKQRKTASTPTPTDSTTVSMQQDHVNPTQSKQQLPNKHGHMTETITTKQETQLLSTKPLDHRFKVIGKSSSLQQAFMERLSGSRFRILNEELYSHSSTESFHRFTTNPKLFDEYHTGFRQQVQSWPENPIDWIVNSVTFHQKKVQSSSSISSPLIVADFGCGEATLAEKLLQISHKKKNTSPPSFVIHSLDLVSNGNPLITACDMAHTPLTTASVDIGVFCLSLMGTNVADFIREAYRVLKPKGILKIAEVRSRFEEGSNNVKTKRHDQSILDQFMESMQQLGFRSTSINQNKSLMFLLLDFIKMDTQIPDPHLVVNLKPCIYKRR